MNKFAMCMKDFQSIDYQIDKLMEGEGGIQSCEWRVEKYYLKEIVYRRQVYS